MIFVFFLQGTVSDAGIKDNCFKTIVFFFCEFGVATVSDFCSGVEDVGNLHCCCMIGDVIVLDVDSGINGDVTVA